MYPEEKRIPYKDFIRVDAKSTRQEITDICRQVGPEEGARFNIQLQAEHLKIIEIGRRSLALQAIPISNSDPALKR